MLKTFGLCAALMASACAGLPGGDGSAQERIGEVREFTRSDVAGALGLARAQDDRASIQCWEAVLARLEALPPPPEAIGAAYAYQRARGFRRIIGGDDAIHIACAAMVSDTGSVVRRLISIATPGI